MAYTHFHPLESLGNFFSEIFDFLKLIIILVILVVLTISYLKKKKNREALADGLPIFFFTKTFKILIYVFLSLLTINYGFNIWKNINENPSHNKTNHTNFESYLDDSNHKIQTINRPKNPLSIGETNPKHDGFEYTAGKGVSITNKIISTSNVCGLSIGDIYEGGIIFYLDASGCHGLISATADQSTGIIWGDVGVKTYSSGNGVGNGHGNSSAIVNTATTTTNYAAQICYNTDILSQGYLDWYLPSGYELNLMYHNIGPGNKIGLGNIGSFSTNRYWSSTEHSENVAWYKNFKTGLYDGDTKSATYSVRAIRFF